MIKEIYDRRSIRKFRQEPVPRDLLEGILQAGIAAPSSKNRQPWKFVVVSGTAKKDMLQQMQKGLLREASEKAVLPRSREYIHGAEYTLKIMEEVPVIVFVVDTLAGDLSATLDTEERIAEICNVQSIGAAIENMSLAAVDMGLGSLWIGDIFFAYEELNTWLAADGVMVAALAIGYPAEQPAARPRKDFSVLVDWRN